MSIGEINPPERKFTKLNNLIGWCVFLIAVFVYWSTIEPTVSFWDCSENIAIYYKLEIGHPPGEPFLQLLQHCISLLSFGDVHKVAPILNKACATFSAFTILFLFWITTFFARKLYSRYGELTEGRMYAILGAGFIAATSFTFTDSLWFSATEASVWAMSACFTALMFWCSTKYARATENSERWLILLSLLIGLAIGVHFLCLLFIPAAVLLYFFKNYTNGFRIKWLNRILSIVTKNKSKQVGISGLLAGVLLLGGVKALVIPGIVGMASWFDLFFVNTLGLPFNSGVLICGLTLVTVIIWGLKYSKKQNKPGFNTAILCATTLIIGYCSFILLVIRANSFTPLNEDRPSDPMSLSDYLDRKQYGSWPQFYGPYYNVSPINTKEGSSVYAKDEKKGKYIEITKTGIPEYDPAMCTYFPRMYDPSQGRPRGYKNWGGDDVVKVKTIGNDGQATIADKPTFGDNMAFFLRYQVGFMFLRYFMWDFCGRQNDIPGLDPPDNLHGNWITGIPFIDNMRAPQENMPDELANNKARNALYGLPLLLGMLGMFFQFYRDKSNVLVIATLFFFTGFAILLYLNQPPYQPRERDYSYVGSFFAFAIWIGLGVLGLFELFTKWAKNNLTGNRIAIAAIIVSLIVPVIMAHAEWDDHDRSGRYTCRDMGIDYLESCPPNAILFTDGDCDTFPLWYAQEVEGIRTDVRVCNLELLGMAWYADQMNRKAYQSDRMPFSLTHDEYREGTRDYLYIAPNYNPKYKANRYYDLPGIIDFIKSNNESNMIQLSDGKDHNYFPTANFSLKVDKEQVLKSGLVPAILADSIVPELDWKISGTVMERNKIMVLDAIAHNNWKRPICFATTLPQDNYMGLEQYLQVDGLVYQLVPVANTATNSVEGHRVATGIMYNNMMNKFRWGNMGSGVYLDDNVRRMAADLRIESGMLATQLVREGKKDSAVKVLDLVTDSVPEKNSPYGYFETFVVQGYYDAQAYQKANKLAKILFDRFENWVEYYKTLDPENLKYYNNDFQEDIQILENLAYLAQISGQKDIFNDFNARLQRMHQQGVF
jgi:Protein of unknown function (DUF2723)